MRQKNNANSHHYMKVLHIIIYIGLIILVNFASSCESKDQSTPIDNPKIESVILSGIKQKADLVTTEITVRKLAIYDSSKHERFQLTNPATWKYGERKCIIPVEVTIKYGYDLRDISMDDVKLNDDSTAVVILLPKPKIIDSGYNAKVGETEIVKMSSGLRDKISHEEVDELTQKSYRSVLEQDMEKLADSDIQNNAKTLFASIVKSLDLKNIDVMVCNKEDWK